MHSHTMVRSATTCTRIFTRVCCTHNPPPPTQVLVYEYVPNGDISDHLYAKFQGHLLTFEERLDAALGLAEGLKYLHYHAEKPIVHRDIKPCNVLLTEDYQVKIADFGLIRSLQEGAEQDGTFTRVAGTRGYLDPEYMTCEKLSTASDVYSYGVLLLEMVTGRPATESDPNDQGCIKHITSWAVPYIDRGDIREIADARIASPLNLPFLLQMARTAAHCVQLPSTRRPDMAEVARVMLDARRTFHAASAAATAGAAALAAAGGAAAGAGAGGEAGGAGFVGLAAHILGVAGALGGKGSPRGAEVGRSGLVGGNSGRALGSESMKRWVHYFGGGGGRSRQGSGRFEEREHAEGSLPSRGGGESSGSVEPDSVHAVTTGNTATSDSGSRDGDVP
ncbi:unnamed protein product [Closterium sp. NIES-53]